MIKVLEVNEVDLLGNRWNGYDMIKDLSSDEFQISQAVTIKMSDNDKVIDLLDTPNKKKCYERLYNYEYEMSIKNIYSLSTPLLLKTKEYKEADIIHFHTFHNAKMSLPLLRRIASEKKVVITLHEAWFMTGRCVYFYDCDKWKSGCDKCDNLGSHFPFLEDNCHEMWNLKKEIFNDLDVDLVYSSLWMDKLVKESPILNKNKHTHMISFGIDTKKFDAVKAVDARKKLGLDDESIVLFLRAQGGNSAKGTNYVVDALKMLKTKRKVTIMTCDGVGLLDEVKDKFQVIDLGRIKDDEMVIAMNACDVFLMPSISESFGFMALEAMACGKPVIIFDNTALPYVTHAPEIGYLVKNLDTKDLASAIKHLVEDDKDRLKRGKDGKKLIHEEYSNEVYNNSLRELYREVNSRKRRRNKLDNTITKDLNQFKYYLNDLSIILLGYNKYSKSLLYDLRNTKRDYNYVVDYNDSDIQNLIIDYCFKLEDIISNSSIKLNDDFKYKFSKLIYYFKYNPNYIMSKFKK